MRTVHQAVACTTAALVATLLLARCVYRVDTQQGNLLDDAQVQQVEVGMTRSQVRFVLGTPMVSDPFSRNRWDYAFYYRPGRGGNVRKSHVIVYFDGDIVTRIDRPDPPPPPTDDKSAPTG